MTRKVKAWMTSGARQPGKVVPWTCFEEWSYVMTCLYSEDDKEVRRGYEMVRLWAWRGRIPTAVEATGNLSILRLDLNARLGSFFSTDTDECDDDRHNTDDLHTLQLASTMALVRFVNEMVDPGQKGSYALPITRLAEQIGLPRNLVDLRHSGTHDELPSLGVIQLALDQSLTWLRHNYWEPGLTWRSNFAIKCSEALEKIKSDLTEFNEKASKISEADVPPPEVQRTRKLKIVAKALNTIEHLQLSHRIQDEFCSVLFDFSLETEGFGLILECLSNWTAGQIVDRMYKSASSRRAIIEFITSQFPNRAEPSVTIEKPRNSGDTDSMLNETDALIRKLEERKKQKLALDSCAKTGLGWKVASNWVPCDLGSPMKFLDFV